MLGMNDTKKIKNIFFILWCEATDEGFSGQYVSSDATLIRPAGTFSRKREKESNIVLKKVT
jgi:hypothetical protein